MLAGPLPRRRSAWRLELDAGPPLGALSDLRVATVFHEGARRAARGRRGHGEPRGASRPGWPMPGRRSRPCRCRSASPTACAPGRTWCCRSSARGSPTTSSTGFTALDALPADDPMTIASGQALVSRYRTWTRANQLRQIQRAAWAELFDRLRRGARAGHADDRVPARHRAATSRRAGARRRWPGGAAPGRRSPGAAPSVSVLLPVVTLPDRPGLGRAARRRAGDRARTSRTCGCSRSPAARRGRRPGFVAPP